MITYWSSEDVVDFTDIRMGWSRGGNGRWGRGEENLIHSYIHVNNPICRRIRLDKVNCLKGVTIPYFGIVCKFHLSFCTVLFYKSVFGSSSVC